MVSHWLHNANQETIEKRVTFKHEHTIFLIMTTYNPSAGIIPRNCRILKNEETTNEINPMLTFEDWRPM